MLELQGFVHCHDCLHRHLWASIRPIPVPYLGLWGHGAGPVGGVSAKRGDQLPRPHPPGYHLSWMGLRLPVDVLARENKRAVWASLACLGNGAMTLPAY